MVDFFSAKTLFGRGFSAKNFRVFSSIFFWQGCPGCLFKKLWKRIVENVSAKILFGRDLVIFQYLGFFKNILIQMSLQGFLG